MPGPPEHCRNLLPDLGVPRQNAQQFGPQPHEIRRQEDVGDRDAGVRHELAGQFRGQRQALVQPPGNRDRCSRVAKINLLTKCKQPFGARRRCVQPDREPVQPPSRHQEDQLAQRPPWGIQARCVYRKITTRSRRDGAEASGVCGSGCGGRQHSARSRKILSCFQRHRYEASGGVFCPSSASHTSPPPLNFTLAPRNAGRIVAPE